MRGYLQPIQVAQLDQFLDRSVSQDKKVGCAWGNPERAIEGHQPSSRTAMLLYAKSNRKITAKALQNGIFMCMFPMKLLGTDSMSIAWGPDVSNSSHESCWLTHGGLCYFPKICLQRLTHSQKSHTGCFRLHKVCWWRLQILYMCSL